MAEETEGSIDAVLCFDANLPNMYACSERCSKNPLVLCRHRFNFNADIKYYNTNQFRGWSDSKILLHALDHVRNDIQKGSLSQDVVVAILTKDIDFLKDAKMELGKDVQGNGLDFFDNYVICGDITIHVKLLDCKNYGTKKLDNLKCAIYKMNKFFKKYQTKEPK